MATTTKGIYYPDNYSAVADIPADMEDLAESVDGLLDNYQGKVAGKGLSQNDFTNAYKDKLDGIEAEANKTIVDSALSDSSTNPVQNKKVYEALEGKVDKVAGKGLSEENYTTAEKTKLAGIEAEANKTIVDDEMSSSSTNPVQNKVLKGIIDAQASEISALRNQIPTGTASGISIDLDDSSDLPFDEFNLKGNSMQGDNPSSENPQTIYSAGDNNSITEKVMSANFFDGALERASIGSDSSIRLRSKNQIDVIGNENFTLSLDSTITSGHIQAMIYEYDKEDNRTQLDSSWHNTPYTFNTSTTTKKIRFVLRKGNDNTLLIEEVYNVQLQKGSIVLPYQAHLQQNITIPCQQPMRRVNTVKDEFVKVSGTWYERHNIENYIFTENDTKVVYSNGMLGLIFPATQKVMDFTKSLLCNKFAYGGAGFNSTKCYSYGNNKISVNNDSGGNNPGKLFYFRDDNLSTTEQWDNLLMQGIEIIYPLTTPTDLPCTAEQIQVLESLKKVHSERTTTHIFSIDDVPATVNATYRKDLTTMFNKLDTLEARIELLEN